MNDFSSERELKAQRPRASAQRGLVLYITTTLPALTVTFIYREIFELEQRGWHVLTCSMNRPPPDTVSLEASGLLDRTRYLDQVGLGRKLIGAFAAILQRPIRASKSLIDAMRPLEAQSVWDVVALVYHFLEAAYLSREYRTCGVQHIHCHFGSGPASIGMFLADFLDVPFSFAMHGTNEFVRRVALTPKLRRCSFAIAIADYIRSHIIEVYGRDFASKVRVMHCGLPMETYQRDDNRRLLRSPGHTVSILSIGQLQRRKGFPILVEACAELRRRGVPFKCEIVGTGPERGGLEELIHKHGLSEDVVLVGAVKQEKIEQYFRKADLLTLACVVEESGDRDGIPVVLMEAMAYGVPVVSTNVSGIPELITNMENGLLVPSEDPLALADAILKIIRDRDLAKRLADAGYAKVYRDYNIARSVDQLEHLLDGAVLHSAPGGTVVVP